MTDASRELPQPTPDVKSDCLGEVQAPSTMEKNQLHAAYNGTNLVGLKESFHF
jgi:hypothetical protein